MTKIYSSVKYGKKVKRKKTLFSSAFFVVILIVSGLLIFTVADLISGFLSDKGSLFNNTNVRVSNSVLYGVCMGQYSDILEAEQVATTIKSQGGAGYINLAGDYFVYASMYDSYADALSVKEKLKKDGIDVKIVNINIPIINFSYSGNSEIVIDAINAFKQGYLKLYDISINYDGGEIDITTAKSDIETLYSTLWSVYENISKIASNNEKVINVALNMSNMLEVLQNLSTIQNTGMAFNSEIKNAYFKIIFLNISLAKAL